MEKLQNEGVFIAAGERVALYELDDSLPEALSKTSKKARVYFPDDKCTDLTAANITELKQKYGNPTIQTYKKVYYDLNGQRTTVPTLSTQKSVIEPFRVVDALPDGQVIWGPCKKNAPYEAAFGGIQFEVGNSKDVFKTLALMQNQGGVWDSVSVSTKPAKNGKVVVTLGLHDNPWEFQEGLNTIMADLKNRYRGENPNFEYVSSDYLPEQLSLDKSSTAFKEKTLAKGRDIAGKVEGLKISDSPSQNVSRLLSQSQLNEDIYMRTSVESRGNKPNLMAGKGKRFTGESVKPRIKGKIRPRGL